MTAPKKSVVDSSTIPNPDDTNGIANRNALNYSTGKGSEIPAATTPTNNNNTKDGINADAIKLKREIGLLEAVAITVGAIIGSGKST